MCSDIAIKVSNLSKCYHVYKQPRDRAKQIFYPPLQRLAGQTMRRYYDEFWALKDISFEIRKGETVGIVGRNGSGKSTLLQLICGTLEPTEGTVETSGRIAALLELGSGFSPEFTGRENVFMNGAILGMSQKQVEARFDAIAAFADIGPFIEQPVKTYSSGMYVRLAFAVNIMSDPEIMVVDEALAVGDMRFQAKCMSALKRIQESGATVLFVSHDIGTVKSLCSRGVYLQKGNIKAIGRGADIAEQYVRASREEMNMDHARFASLASEQEETAASSGSDAGSAGSPAIFKVSAEFDARVAASRYGTGEATITYVEMLDAEGNEIVEAEFNQEVQIKLYFVSQSRASVAPSYYILDDKKNLILGAGPRQLGASLIEADINGRFVVTYRTRLPLQEGAYSIQFQLTEPIVPDESAKYLDVIDDAIVFRVSRKTAGRIWTKVFLPNTLTVEPL